MKEHAIQVQNGKRFQFGKNWQAFLSVLDDERIAIAVDSVKEKLEVESLDGLTFLDIGSGSGLFSLAAKKLDAHVHSFDFDPQSVECTNELKRRYFANNDDWIIEEASALDDQYLDGLGQFDVVYSWGVLHHTGHMWDALDNASKLVKPGGKLFISIYNHQVYFTPFNVLLKKTYNKSPSIGKYLISGSFVAFQIVKGVLKDILFFRNPLRRYTEKKKSRGMSMWYDWIDWVGGYPFEVAKPEEIFEFFKKKNFTLVKLKTVGGGYGCNEFVFKSNA